jgi:hypothetical protein
MSNSVSSNISWYDFNDDKVILPICVRSPNVQGRNFIAMLEAMQTRINHVEIVLCDYLDRYNLDHDGDLAIKQSQEWQSSYLAEVRQRFKTVNVTDWHAIMAYPTFKDRYKKICNLYKTNEDVKKAIDINVDIYVEDKIKRIVKETGWGYDPYEIKVNSRNYLLEEYAGIAIYKNFVPSQSQIYWGVYIGDIHIFNRHSGDVNLIMPRTLPVKNNRLGSSICSIVAPLENIGMAA